MIFAMSHKNLFPASLGFPRIAGMKRGLSPRRLVACLVWAAGVSISAGQANYVAPELMNYAGTLKTAAGAALPDGNYDVEFRIYNVASGGAAAQVVWGPQEFDGAAGVGHTQQVTLTGGRFNAILGPLDTLSRSLLASLQASVGSGLYLELAVQGTPLAPRQLLLSTPFAMIASNGFPRGAIAMWFGASVPSGWAFCDGTNGTPDLRARFIKGAGGSGFDQVNTAGGAAAHSHTLPSHNHVTTQHTHSMAHTHTIGAHLHSVDPPSTSTSTASNNSSIVDGALLNKDYAKSHSHTLDVAAFNSSANSTETTGAPTLGNTSIPAFTASPSTAPATPNQFHEPPDFTLAFIMKL